MKIFIVGSNKVYAIENIYVKYLRSLNAEVFHYAAQSKFYDFYYHSTYNKLIYRLGFSNFLNTINNEIVREIKCAKPDFVLIFKGMEVFPETIKVIKAMGIKVINYNPDNPFIFSGKGSGNKNITNSIGLYDLHFTYNTEVKNKIEKEYKMPVKILPFGFEVDEELYIKCVNQPEITKVCFLGNPDKERAGVITSLAEEGILMDIYGNNWYKWISPHPNLVIYPPVYEEELWKILRKYRVQLNVMRIHNLNSHNMRSFEVPGVGGIMVAPRTIDHEVYFENQKEIFLYKLVTDCVKTIRELLNLSSTEALRIRENARIRSIASGYTYKDRTKQLLTELQKL